MLFYAFKMAVAIAFLRENSVKAIYFFFCPCSTVIGTKVTQKLKNSKKA